MKDYKNSNDFNEDLKRVIVHELAHMWMDLFYEGVNAYDIPAYSAAAQKYGLNITCLEDAGQVMGTNF